MQYVLYAVSTGLCAVGGLLLMQAPVPGMVFLVAGCLVGIKQLRDDRRTRGRESDLLQTGLQQVYATTGKSPWLIHAREALARGTAIPDLLAILTPEEVIHRDDVEYYRLLGGVCTLHAAAHHFFSERSRRTQRARAVADRYVSRGLALAPSDGPLTIARGILFDLDNRHADAQAAFRTAGQTLGNDLWRLPLILSLSYTKSWTEALQHIDALRTSGHRNWLFHYYAAAVYAGMGRHSKARRECRLAFVQQPRNPLVIDALARATQFSGRFFRATSLNWRRVVCTPLTVAITTGQPLAVAWVHSGVCAWIYAANTVAHITGRRPRAPQPFKTLAYRAYRLGEYWQAAVLFRMAHRISGNVDWLNECACAVALAGYPEYAIVLLNRVLRVAPTHAQARSNRATFVRVTQQKAKRGDP